MNTEQKTNNLSEKQKIHDKNELQPCPNCRKPNHKDARICTCGFWLKTEDFLQASQLPQIKKERFKNKIKKTAAVSVFIIVCGWLVLYWNGYGNPVASLENNLENIEEKTASSNQSISLNAQNVAEKKSVSKGIIEGKVIAVNSGEMITVSDRNNNQYEIRLGGIDAPDVSEDFGEQAKNNLSNLILNKNVRVLLQKVEENGRLVGKVLHNGKNINLEQVSGGLAKHNVNDADEQTEADRKIYAETELTAKNSGNGIWSTESEKDLIPEQKNETALAVKQSPQSVQPKTEKSFDKADSTVSSETSEPVAVNDGKSTSKPAEKNISGKTTGKSVKATARCADGTLSFSSTRSGACSFHGGVAVWFDGSNSSKTSVKKTTVLKYIRGPRGGCYYLNSKGNKTYVDRSLCL